MNNKTLFLLIFTLLPSLLFSQDKRGTEWAGQNVREAMRMMDDGFFDQSIKLIKESLDIDPKNAFYQYELGLAYYKKTDYKDAAKIFEKLSKQGDAYDQVFQMLGNSYDMQGDRKKAIKAYEKGIERFPNSGKLYLERSVIHMMEKEYNEAVGTLEKGVSVDPMHSSNYYWLAKLYMLDSEYEVWGMIYGELFMHLELSTNRSKEIAKILYDTYKKEITINGDSVSVSFCKNAPINITVSEGALDDPEYLVNAMKNALKKSFGNSVYEKNMLLAIIGEKDINIASLDRIRSKFVDLYFQNDYEDHPNVLFELQKKIKDAGHFEAYNYWLLSHGNDDEFEIWLEKRENVDKMNTFFEWYDAHQSEVVITQENKFLRPQ